MLLQKDGERSRDNSVAEGLSKIRIRDNPVTDRLRKVRLKDSAVAED
jgi:hypothetical protein